jgi:O-antigen biosynthesis protein
LFNPIKVIELEISQPIPTVEVKGYETVQGLVRWQGVPIGWIQAPVVNGQCSASQLGQLIFDEHSDAIWHQVWLNALVTKKLHQPLDQLLHQSARLPLPLPKVTVAVCTRDRPTDLARCLTALTQITDLEFELLVVDNAPSTDATQQVVEKLTQRFPQIRYVQEPRPGLNWARNRAILEATGEVIAYIDDDVVVDPQWVRALAEVFAQHPMVMGVTGLVVPAELETEAQVLFEQNGGFGKGFWQWEYCFPNGQGMHWGHLGTGNLGTGANMAFRKAVFSQVGYFDPALDVGTPTHGAGDLEMFFRILKAGWGMIYEPRALVWHYHRSTYAQLRTQLQNNGSVYAYFVRSVLAHPKMAPAFLRLGLSWLWWGHLFPLLTAAFYPASFPQDLRWAQLWGCLRGLTSYFQSQRKMQAVIQQWGDLPALPETALPEPPKITTAAIAVRTVELTQFQALDDVAGHRQTRLFVTYQGTLLGEVDVLHAGQPLSRVQIAAAILKNLGWKRLAKAQNLESVAAMDQLLSFLRPSKLEAKPQLSPDIPVSVVIGTCDRPDTLRICLQQLVAQITSRPVEVVVVDNRPASGLTAPIVAEFPTVKLVNEARQGVAYARNAGILASTGEIIVTVDDDVSMPPDWLETLLTPFTEANVIAVTGNVLPVELETYPQHLFEEYGSGGLGRGFDSFTVGRAWFERSWRHAVPTWELGGTANSAYRAWIFRSPAIGLMDEALGPGMPSGVGEDIYLFYKILKAGGTIRYHAQAYVWHQHRREMAALKRQIYNYSKGFTSYHLTTLLKDRDYRALMTLFIFLPLYHLKQSWEWLKGDRFYPLSLIWVEVAGNLAGFWSLWRSRQRVQQQGRSLEDPKPTSVQSTPSIELVENS